jgi:soluble lytic murein transglycosylase
MARRLGFQVIRAGGVGILATLVVAVACGRAQEPAQTATLIMGPVVSGSDMALLRDGLTGAQYGDWTRVRGARASAADPLVRKILSWRLAAAQNSDSLFSEVDQALTDLKAWPGRDTMRRRGEQMIIDSGLSAEQRIAWLTADGAPLSGDGQAALAIAYAQTGKTAEAGALARDTWRERALTPRAENLLLSQFSSVITDQDTADRVDRMLWRDDRSGAQRLLSRLDPADRAVANARIALQANEPLAYRKTRKRKAGPGVSAKLAAVPASRTETPGLLYDRARYVRRAGRPEDALPIISKVNALEAAPSVREALSAETRLYVPRALRAGQYSLAYNLAANHGLTFGEGFADAEWLAGWIALRFLKDPTKAAGHFSHLDANVSTPVSKARALYWRGEAASALNQTADADAAMAQAAAYSFTYYGQLAALKHDPAAMLSLVNESPVTPEARAAFEKMELVRALRLVAQSGDRSSFELISFYLDDQLASPAEHEMLAELARANFYNRVAVRSAKAGIRRNIVAQEAAFPLIDLPDSARGADRPEPALLLAIARQESEFDAQAISPVGARGLMQLMPATARTTAKRSGMSYSPGALTGDQNYNLTLGSAYLQELIDQFNGSYVLAIASYNAGPGRANQWIGDWGDPRSGQIDVVDWVELIPITETRNYVQRVMENLQVYRYRLAAGPTPIKLEADLRRHY